MKLVIIESPYAGDIETHVEYARACISDSLRRGEAPIASHLLYTQPRILNDNVLGERALGLKAGWAWYKAADICAVYVDHGISAGMARGIIEAHTNGIPVEVRWFKNDIQRP